MTKKECPYCGEEIAASAKKCRFCGEWLEDPITMTENQVESISPAETMPIIEEPIELTSFEGEGILPELSNQPVTKVETPTITPGSTPNQTVMSVGGQPIVLNINQNQNVEQKVEQTVIVADNNSKEAPGWIFTEIWCIAAGVGFALKSWWWFFGIGVIGSILLMVPFIGAMMCVIIGLAWGFLAWAIGAAIFSTSAGWVIGILVAMGAIYGHLEARKQNMEEE